MAPSPNFSQRGKSSGLTKPATVKLHSAMLSKPFFGTSGRLLRVVDHIPGKNWEEVWCVSERDENRWCVPRLISRNGDPRKHGDQEQKLSNLLMLTLP